MATNNTNTLGSAGFPTQMPGQPTTVSGVAAATGGIAPGNLIETDIDEELFKIQSEDTPLMSFVLKSRKVNVKSPEVEHYMIDEQRSLFKTSAAVTASSNQQFDLPLLARDQNIPRPGHTLLVQGVDGYEDNGSTTTPGRPLMLYVKSQNTNTGNPIVMCVNGPKASSGDTVCTTPAIAKGTVVNLLANALYETQKEVDPDLILPQPTLVYLQKRGMNQVVSDYFDAQRKHIPFTQRIIAEQAICNFKRASNRTFWVGRKGKTTVQVSKLGNQTVYFTEGIRWQVRRELQHTGRWTIEELIALAKLLYCSEDQPKRATLLAGKDLCESLQCIDFSKHPEIKISFESNTLGWTVTRIHTIFGDIDIKRDPTLDTLGLSASGMLIGEDRLVHYTYATEHNFSDRIEGEEATRMGVLVWDAVALKGTCHIWINGNPGNALYANNPDALALRVWGSDAAPSGGNLADGVTYYLTSDCPGINAGAVSGTTWQATVTTTGDGDQKTTTVTWKEVTGTLLLTP